MKKGLQQFVPERQQPPTIRRKEKPILPKMKISVKSCWTQAFFSSQSLWPEYQVFFLTPEPGEDYYGVPWSGYRWDSDHQKFRDDLIEYKLFVEHNPQEAVVLADQILPLLEEWKNIPDVRWWMPYRYYLIGLSYELLADQGKAAQIYWQLWHDFPDSHYARLAEFKLERITR